MYLYSTNLQKHLIVLFTDPYLNIHASGSDSGQRDSESWHFYNAVVDKRMGPGQIQTGDFHIGGYTCCVSTTLNYNLTTKPQFEMKTNFRPFFKNSKKASVFFFSVLFVRIDYFHPGYQSLLFSILFCFILVSLFFSIINIDY